MTDEAPRKVFLTVAELQKALAYHLYAKHKWKEKTPFVITTFEDGVLIEEVRDGG